MIDVGSNEMISVDVPVRKAVESKEVLTRSLPEAYVILPGNSEVIDKLTLLGVKSETLPKSQTADVEIYQVVNYERSPFKYEGVYRQDVETETKVISRNLPEGSSIVYTDQEH